MKTNIFILAIASLLMTACPSPENRDTNGNTQTNQNGSNIAVNEKTTPPVGLPTPLANSNIEGKTPLPSTNTDVNQTKKGNEAKTFSCCRQSNREAF